MKNKILLIVGLALIIAGCAVSYFANFANADVIGFAVTMFGAGVSTATMWEKRDVNKKWYYSAIPLVAVGVGAFILGFGGFAESQMTMILTAVGGIVAIIGGIIALNVNKK